MSKHQIFIVEPEQLPECWPYVHQYIEDACNESHGELSTQTIIDKLRSAQMMLAVVLDTEARTVDAAVTYEKRMFDSGAQVLFIATCGGHKMHEWLPALNIFSDALAKLCECDQLYISGRKGWTKVLNDIGYKPIHTVYSKEVH